MKKTILFFTMFINALFANNAYEDTFKIERSLNELPTEIRNIIKNDKLYELAVLQLTNKEYMASRNIKSGRSHNPDSIKEATVKVPNFNEAYENFKKSYNKHNNPISALAITYLIKTSFGKKNKLADYAYYSKINYANKLCSGYIDYGEVLQKGYFQKVDINEAIKVYKKGLLNCKKGWYSTILSSKLMSLQ